MMITLLFADRRSSGRKPYLSLIFSWTNRAIWRRRFLRSARLTSMRFWSALFPPPFSGVPLLAEPACWDLPLEELQRMLFWLCANQDEDFWGGLELVFVWVLNIFFFLKGASTAPRTVFWGWISWHSVSSTFLKFLNLLFTLFCLLGHRGCDFLVDELSNEFGINRHLPVNFMAVSSVVLVVLWPFSSFYILSSNS